MAPGTIDRGIRIEGFLQNLAKSCLHAFQQDAVARGAGHQLRRDEIQGAVARQSQAEWCQWLWCNICLAQAVDCLAKPVELIGG